MNNNKEIYELVMSKMCEQNAQSVNDSGTCMYRGPNGLKCAVGHLIDDEAYSEKLECKTIDSIYVQEAVTQSCSRLGFVVDYSTFKLLSHMQQVHDGYSKHNHKQFDIYFKEQVPLKLNLNYVEVPTYTKVSV